MQQGYERKDKTFLILATVQLSLIQGDTSAQDVNILSRNIHVVEEVHVHEFVVALVCFWVHRKVLILQSGREGVQKNAHRFNICGANTIRQTDRQTHRQAHQMHIHRSLLQTSNMHGEVHERSSVREWEGNHVPLPCTGSDV